MGIKYARFNSGANVFGFLISLIIVAFYSILTVLICMKVWVFSKKSKDQVEELHKFTVNKKWDFLQMGVKKTLPFAPFVIAMNVIKDFVVAPFIVLGIESVYVQVIPIILLTLLIASFVLVRKPFEGWIENATLILNNVCYTGILIIFLLIEKDNLGPKEKYNRLGTPCVIMIIIVLLINLIVAIITMISLVVQACKKARARSLTKVS